MLEILTEIDRLVVDLATRLATARCEALENAIEEGLARTATALGLGSRLPLAGGIGVDTIRGVEAGDRRGLLVHACRRDS
jgi:hypothetical protein